MSEQAELDSIEQIKWRGKMRKRMGANLRKRRLEDGLTLRELEKAVRFTRHSLRLWEVGAVSIPMDKLLQVCKMTGWKISDILK